VSLGCGDARYGRRVARSELSMKSCAEITGRYATAYAKASRKGKSLILDQVVDITGWARDNTRFGGVRLPVYRVGEWNGV
jgi:hypothetical protein